MCDNETFKIQCETMRHLKYNVWQWDIYNTMCDNETFQIQYNVTMRQYNDNETLKIQCWHNETYNVWHNETFQIQCVTQWDISNTMCDTMRHFKYNVWHNGTFQIQCVTQWDISNTMCDIYNTMCDNETFEIQWDILNTMLTMRHLNTMCDIWNTMCDNETFQIQCVTQLQCVTQWDMSNTMCDTMRHFKYNVWHNETF